MGLLAVGISLAFPFIAFSPTPAGDGQILNLYVHLLGFALGFIPAYVTFRMIGVERVR